MTGRRHDHQGELDTGGLPEIVAALVAGGYVSSAGPLRWRGICPACRHDALSVALTALGARLLCSEACPRRVILAALGIDSEATV